MHADQSASASPFEVASWTAEAARAPVVGAVPRWLLLSISFWGGLQIMALEMCGFRALQVNLGSSVLVTGTLLTVVMILLAAGYYMGGRRSARAESPRGLLALLALAALYSVIASALLGEPLATLAVTLREALASHLYLRIIVPAAVLTVGLYGPPMFIMSMISPYLIQLQTRAGESDEPGVRSGFFMSLSTFGSIAGTMLASYVLIPLLGTTFTATSTAGVFFGLACAGWLQSPMLSVKARRIGALAASAAALGLAAVGLSQPAPGPNVVYAAESLYGEIRIEKAQDAAGRSLLRYHPSRVYTHSVLYPEEPLRDLEGLMYLTPGLLRPPRTVLVLGSAVGGILRSIEIAFPQARAVGVDLDPAVHKVATDVFGVDPARNTLVTADARLYLVEHPETYDLIIVDLFAGEFTPPHCISREFFGLVRDRLAPGGSVFVNSNMNDIPYELPLASEPFRTPRHLAATLHAAGFRSLFENSFFHSLFAFRDELPIARLRHDLLAWSSHAERPAPLRAIAGMAAFTTVAVPVDRRYRPFTDAWAPALAIELKTNAHSIYGALRDSPASAPAVGDTAAQIASAALRALLASWGTSEEPELRDLAPLIGTLNRVEQAAPPAAIDTAAKYFRFEADPRPSATSARTPWARLARLYAALQWLGHQNEYEALLPVLDELRQYVR